MPAESETVIASKGGDFDRYEERYGDYDGSGYHYLPVPKDIVYEDGEDPTGVGGYGQIGVEHINRTNSTGTVTMHELGHSLGLLPAVHAGIDSEQVSYSEYPSVMDHNSPSDEYVFSSGDASTDDFDDWGYLEQYMYTPDPVTISDIIGKIRIYPGNGSLRLGLSG